MNKFEKRLKDELNQTTPDLKENIRKNIEIKPKQKVKWQRVAMPIVAVMVLMVAIITPIMVINPDNSGGGAMINSYTLAISVNPSVEVVYDKNNVVTSVSPLNKDGMLILQSNKLKTLNGKNVNEATNLIIEEMNVLGYFNKNDEIKLTVKSDKGEFVASEYDEIKTNIQSKLSLIGLSKNINKLTEDELDLLEDDIEENAEAYFNEFKEDIKNYLNEKAPIVDQLAKDIFSQLITINEFSSLTDYKDINAIKLLLKDNETPFDNQQIIDLINNYNLIYDEIEDEIECYDDFYDMYEDLLEIIEETNDAISDINKGIIPDDVDDIIEDIIEQQIDD